MTLKARFKRFLKKDYVYERGTVILVCLAYGFTALNCIVFSILWRHPVMNKYLIALGVVLGCIPPLSYFGAKEGLQGWKCALTGCAIHLAVTILTVCESSWLGVIFTLAEVGIGAAVIRRDVGRYRVQKALEAEEEERFRNLFFR